jgi:hypothetical protein
LSQDQACYLDKLYRPYLSNNLVIKEGGQKPACGPAAGRLDEGNHHDDERCTSEHTDREKLRDRHDRLLSVGGGGVQQGTKNKIYLII